MRYSQIRTKDLSRVFQQNDVLSAQTARLAVLYEDLRIELTAATKESIRDLDHLSPEYRRFYFVRRSIATILEMADCIGILNNSTQAAYIFTFMAPEARRHWTEAVRFFDRQRDFFVRVRNDVGGTFRV